MMFVKITIYDVDYTCYDVIWGKDIAYGIFTSLHGLCGVMGLHISIVLGHLDGDCD